MRKPARSKGVHGSECGSLHGVRAFMPLNRAAQTEYHSGSRGRIYRSATCFGFQNISLRPRDHTLYPKRSQLLAEHFRRVRFQSVRYSFGLHLSRNDRVSMVGSYINCRQTVPATLAEFFDRRFYNSTHWFCEDKRRLLHFPLHRCFEFGFRMNSRLSIMVSSVSSYGQTFITMSHVPKVRNVKRYASRKSFSS